MASGLSTRFEGNKLIASLGGAPLIQYVIKATENAFSKRLVVTRHKNVATLCKELGVAALLHNKPNRNDTVRLGLEALGTCQSATFMQADQPLVSKQTISRLLRRFEAQPEFIWRTSFEGEPAAPVLFPPSMFEELCALPKGKGGGFVVKNHPDRVRTVEVGSKWELFDVDTQEDLRQIEKHLRNANDNLS